MPWSRLHRKKKKKKTKTKKKKKKKMEKKKKKQLLRSHYNILKEFQRICDISAVTMQKRHVLPKVANQTPTSPNLNFG